MTWDQLQSEFSRIESSSGNLSRHLSNLLGAHRALVSSELKEQRSKVYGAAACFLGTALSGLCALFMLALSLGEALSNNGLTMSRASAYAIVALLFALLAGAGTAAGLHYSKRVSPVPRESIQSLKETVSCLLKRQL